MSEPDLTSAQALEVLRTQSLAQVVRSEIEHMILGGQLRAGEQLNESQLARRLGVSRGPVREALRGLQHAGLVTAVVNRGTFVRELSRDEAADVYDIRASLAGLAAQILAVRITAAQLETLSRLVTRMEVTREIDGYYPLNLEFHARIMEFCGNARLEALYQGCAKELHLYRRKALVFGGGLAVSNAEHRQVRDALADGDAEQARRAMERHIQAGKERFLKAVTREDQGGQEEHAVHEDQER